MSPIARRLKVKNNIDTDLAISKQHKADVSDIQKLAKHFFENVDADFAARLCKGDVLIAGDNFGAGGSEELSLEAFKSAGISVVIAKSYGRMFYRNAVNRGILPVECNTDFIDDGDEIAINAGGGKVQNISKGLLLESKPIPAMVKRFLDDGGVVEHFKKNGGFKFE